MMICGPVSYRENNICKRACWNDFHNRYSSASDTFQLQCALSIARHLESQSLFVRISAETGLDWEASPSLLISPSLSLSCQQLKRTNTRGAMVSLALAHMECNEAAGSFPSRSMIQLVDQGQTSRQRQLHTAAAGAATFTAQRKLRKQRLSLQFAVDVDAQLAPHDAGGSDEIIFCRR